MASTIARVSLTSSGMQADGASALAGKYEIDQDPTIAANVFSADGSEIVFVTSAKDITGDGSSQVVIKNLTTGVDTLETGGASVATATSATFTPDGQKLIIEGFANGAQQIFEKDPTSGTTTLVSSDSTGAAGNNYSSVMAVSTTGNRVAFSSASNNLVAGQTSGASDFVKDVGTGNIVQLGDGQTDTATSGGFGFSSNLSEAVYTNEANDESGPPPEVYAENLTDGTKTLVSGTAAVAGDKGGFDGMLLSNGTEVAFNSESTNLVAGAPSGGVFVKNLTTGTISTVLANQVTTSGNETSGTGYELVAASPTSRQLAFESFTADMVTNADGSNYGSATTQISVTDLAGATAAVTPSASYTFTGGPGPITDPGYESPFGPSADSQSGTINGTVYGGVTYSPDGTKIAYSQDTYTNYAYDFSAATPTQSGTLSSQVFVYDTQTGTSTAVTDKVTDDLGARSGSFYASVSFSPNSQDIAVEQNTVGQGSPQTIVTNLASGARTSVPIDSSDIFFAPNGRSIAFTSSNPLTPDDTNAVSDVFVAPVCFASGTRITTTRGDVAVEDLAIGDLAVTTSGARRPIIWVGHRTIDCRACHDRAAVLPVRITAHALGSNKPSRDLHVSPGHAICVDVAGEVLIPASSLVNGITIARVDVARVIYWHVELEGGHDILLAENLPVESYIDVGNRAFFLESNVTALGATPDGSPATNSLVDYCRPYVADGPVVAAVRARLEANAGAALAPVRRKSANEA